MSTGGGKLFLLSGWGSERKITTFDTTTGNKLWSRRIAADLIFSSSSIVIASDCDSLYALDINTGDEIWHKNFLKYQGENCIMNATFVQGTLYVVGNKNYAIEAQTGNIIQEKAYAYYSDVLKTISLQTEIPAVIGNSFYQRGILYRREGEFHGKISAVNTDNSNMPQIIWESKDAYVSNIAVSQKGLYALTLYGSIMRLDIKNGSSYPYISFTPTTLDLGANDSCKRGTPFYIAIDDSTNMMFVLLGDSNQIYAFQMK